MYAYYYWFVGGVGVGYFLVLLIHGLVSHIRDEDTEATGQDYDNHIILSVITLLACWVGVIVTVGNVRYLLVGMTVAAITRLLHILLTHPGSSLNQ